MHRKSIRKTFHSVMPHRSVIYRYGQKQPFINVAFAKQS